MSRFVLEVRVNGVWVPCECDGEVETFTSRADAETEARWSLDAEAAWRVVPVGGAS